MNSGIDWAEQLDSDLAVEMVASEEPSTVVLKVAKMDELLVAD